MSKSFFDTNIFVYAFDNNDPDKKRISKELISKAGREGTGVLSTQVLQEFYVTCTKKLGVEPLTAKGYMSLLTNFDVIEISPNLIESAIDCSVINKISFWDALIVSAASFAKCTTLYSEDLNHDQVIKGVRVWNPFNI